MTLPTKYILFQVALVRNKSNMNRKLIHNILFQVVDYKQNYSLLYIRPYSELGIRVREAENDRMI